MKIYKCDVAIIGGGLSGLISAKTLRDYGLNVYVVEAKNRLGGRILDYQTQCGHTFSLGAEWLGSEENRLHSLIKEFSLKTSKQHEEGKLVFDLLGKKQMYGNDEYERVGPLPLPKGLVPKDFQDALQKISNLSQQISVETPYKGPIELDEINMEQWCQENINSHFGRKLFEVVIKEETGQELENLSLLYFLFMWQSIVSKLVDDRRILGGTAQIITGLANRLKNQVFLESPVSKLEYNKKGATLYSNNITIEATFCIVAVPPPLLKRIDFVPSLPEEKQKLNSNMSMGRIIKCIIIYNSPFWRQHGFSGISISDRGPLESTFDCSPNKDCGALAGFIMGNEAEKWSKKSAIERKNAVIEQLMYLFGESASDPLEYVDQNWIMEEWIGGAYYATMPKESMTKYGSSLRKPVECIHWAGTETAKYWCGSMEGAILAGEKAAQEVYQRFTKI